MNTITGFFRSLLGFGIEAKDLSFTQISLRGIVIFTVALILMRLSDRRSLTKKSPFDQVLLVILASALARAINGSAAFFATIGGAAVIVGLHRLLAWSCCRWPGIAVVIKGHPTVLVRDGELQERALRRKNVPEDDIYEDLRLSAKVEELEKVKVARLEVNGDVSFILREKAGG